MKQKFKIKQVKRTKGIHPDFDKQLEEWAWYLNKAKFWIWCAFAPDGEWAGFSAMAVYDDETCYQGPVWVQSAYRGNGLQYRMLKAKLRAAKRMKFKRAIAIVYFKKVQSCNNLIKAGFRLVEPWQGATGEGELYFEKLLSV